MYESPQTWITHVKTMRLLRATAHLFFFFRQSATTQTYKEKGGRVRVQCTQGGFFK